MMDPPQLIGTSPAFLATLDHVSAAAGLDRPVLVIGERGTGKELIAARLHFLSPRWDQAYVRVNCAALSEDLLDSELFGHEKGAFTGATDRRAGRFERADGGTLFLDEIASASSRVQEKLLRAVEYGEFERLGGNETLRANVRVIGATNVDLPYMVEQGKFRADLLDRMAFDVITLPPLRYRYEDIVPLAENFGAKMAAELGAERFPGFTAEVMEALVGYKWPGNVRELKNVAERAAGFAFASTDKLESPIAELSMDPFDNPWRPRAKMAGGGAAHEGPAPNIEDALPEIGNFKARIHNYEARLLSEALKQCDNHQGNAAKRLGLTYHAFRGMLKKHDLFPASSASKS